MNRIIFPALCLLALSACATPQPAARVATTAPSPQIAAQPSQAGDMIFVSDHADIMARSANGEFLRIKPTGEFICGKLNKETYADLFARGFYAETAVGVMVKHLWDDGKCPLAK